MDAEEIALELTKMTVASQGVAWKETEPLKRAWEINELFHDLIDELKSVEKGEKESRAAKFRRLYGR